jgi:predicted secreted hydrolase
MEMSLGGFQDSDDAMHSSDNKDYYEWWYFDARMENGYSCVATFHWLNAFIRPHIPTVQLFIYTPEGKKHIGMAALKVDECFSSPSKCDVKMGENFARQENNIYQIRLHARNLGVELTYHRCIPGWKQNGTGYLYDNGTQKQGWIISAPRSDVEGKLFINGETINVRGQGYHDKNWGNSNIYDCFSGWYWGRLYDSQFTLIYYWLFPADNTEHIISRLLLAKDNKPILISNDYEFSVSQSEACNLFGKPLPRKIVINNEPRSEIKFHCELNTTEIVERDRLPKISEWDQYHWRFLGQYNIEVTDKAGAYQSSGIALHEHLRFR